MTTPSQTRHPWKATLRTALAVIVGIGLALPVVWGIVGEELGDYLPAAAQRAIAWGVGLVTAISLAVTRIIAIPQVDAALTRIGLGAESRDEGA